MSWKYFCKKYQNFAKQLTGLYPEEIAKILKAKRYRKIPHNQVFRSARVIVKCPGTIVGKLNKLPKKHVIPTIEFFDKEGSVWHIQARAKTVSERKISWNTICKELDFLEKRCPDWSDAHDGNLGLYKGKPVIIDW
jgi:hypothetical protein